MNWFNNLSTRAKLTVGFSLMGLLLLAVVAVAYIQLTALQTSQSNLYAQDFTRVRTLLRLRSHENRIRAILLEMMQVDDPERIEVLEAELQALDMASAEQLVQLANTAGGDLEFQRQVEQLESLIATYHTTQNLQLDLIRQGEVAEALALSTGIQTERFQEMLTLLTNMGELADEVAQRKVVEATERTNQTIFFFIIISVTALLVAAGIVAILGRVIAGPLRDLTHVAEQIAGGNLALTLSPNGRADEVGSLEQAFARMTENLRLLTSDIAEAVNVLASSASEILAATSQVASGTTETATAINQTTSTVEEIRQAAQLSAQKARSVSERAQQSSQIAQSGRQAVERSVDDMTVIAEQMQSIAETIVRLSEQSQAIGNIIVTVNDLADQSNLLAVNAAIEAAKAGEHGKGFAVVAQEIGNLADQSKRATAQVREILNDIQKVTGTAVMVTEQGGKAVDQGVRQTTASGESIRALADSVSEASQASIQIAASSQQQMVGMDQVASAMENINEAISQNVASTRQVETTAQNLNELGQRLKQLVDRFQV